MTKGIKAESLCIKSWNTLYIIAFLVYGFFEMPQMDYRRIIFYSIGSYGWYKVFKTFKKVEV